MLEKVYMEQLLKREDLNDFEKCLKPHHTVKDRESATAGTTQLFDGPRLWTDQHEILKQ